MLSHRLNLHTKGNNNTDYSFSSRVHGNRNASKSKRSNNPSANKRSSKRQPPVSVSDTIQRFTSNLDISDPPSQGQNPHPTVSHTTTWLNDNLPTGVLVSLPQARARVPASRAQHTNRQSLLPFGSPFSGSNPHTVTYNQNHSHPIPP